VASARDQHRIPHDLSLELARRVTRAALTAYRTRFGRLAPTGQWIDEDHAVLGFVVAGRRIEGQVIVQPAAIVLQLDVPAVFRPLRRQAIEIIEAEVRGWIERAHAGELDEG